MSETKTNRKRIILIAAAVIIVAVMCFAASAAKDGGLQGTAWALVPPVIAISLALITREVYSSLFIGVVLGGIMYSNFSFDGTVTAIVNDGLIPAVRDSAGIFIFLIILGVIVALVNRVGGTNFIRPVHINIRT